MRTVGWALVGIVISPFVVVYGAARLSVRAVRATAATPFFLLAMCLEPTEDGRWMGIVYRIAGI